jgi:hypothetical protein
VRSPADGQRAGHHDDHRQQSVVRADTVWPNGTAALVMGIERSGPYALPASAATTVVVIITAVSEGHGEQAGHSPRTQKTAVFRTGAGSRWRSQT